MRRNCSRSALAATITPPSCGSNMTITAVRSAKRTSRLNKLRSPGRRSHRPPILQHDTHLCWGRRPSRYCLELIRLGPCAFLDFRDVLKLNTTAFEFPDPLSAIPLLGIKFPAFSIREFDRKSLNL